jgi:Hemerythrin HHE cation binding domain
MSDVVDFLIGQHDRMRGLCDEVAVAAGPERHRLFAELGQLVNAHEFGDRTVVHPAARDSTPAGDAVGVACMAEEGRIERAIDDLQDLGTGHATFEARFAALRRAVLEHNEHEERDEFPLLRLYVRPQRLHMMVGQLHDVQTMGAR